MLATLLVLCTLMLVIVLLVAESRGRPNVALAAKACASLCFVLLGVLELEGTPTLFDKLLLVGLVCAALGDVLLAASSERAFRAGVAAFGLGHVAYVVAARDALGAAALPNAVWFVLLPSTAAYLWLYRHLGAMRVPIAVYIGVITVMVMYAVALYVARSTAALPFLLGALLFYASDLSVARDRFVRSALINRLWGLPAYYAGQLLLASSIASL